MIHQARIESDFPALAGKAYFNTAAEGIPPIDVGAALTEYLRDKQLGMDGREAHFRKETECREVVARLLKRLPDEIGFCSCSAEAYNLLSTALALESGDEVVLNDLDFPSGVTPWFVSRSRPKVKIWRAVGGALELSDLKPLLTPHTRLVQLSLVSFYNGYRLDWEPVLECIRKSAPSAIIALDITQALGRCVFDCSGADILISSTHKWAMGIHGGCVVAVRHEAATRLTTKAGGWYNLIDPFGEARFSRVESKCGAASYAVGMPGFAAIYALNAGLRYLEKIGINELGAHADALVAQVHAGLIERGLVPMSPFNPKYASGIIAFRHPAAVSIYEVLHQNGIHVMHHAGRLRIAVHGYNTAADISQLWQGLNKAVKRVVTQ